MLTQALEVMKYVKTSAGRSSLNVVFERTNQPRHDGNTIYLPQITARTTEKELKDMMCSTDHEVAHDLYSDFNILEEKNIDTSNSLLGIIMNVVEDSRVNSIEAMQYEGFRQLWDETSSNYFDKMVADKEKIEASDFGKLITALFQWETHASGDLFPVTSVAAARVETNPAIMVKLDPFTERLHGLRHELDKKSGSAKSYELAKDVFRALGGDPDAEEKRNKDRKEGKPEPTTPSTGKGEGKEDLAPDEWTIVEVTVDKKLADDIVKNHERMRKVGIKHDSDPSKRGDWTMTPYEQFEVINYVRGTAPSAHFINEVNSKGSGWFITEFKERVEGKAALPEAFANQVRRAIQIRSRSRYEFGIKKGKLDQARLSRIVIPSPGFNERIFKRKIVNDVLDAAVTVLVDMSGSMSGDKAFYACESTLLLNHVFSVLNVPIEILGFTDSIVTVNPGMFVYKDFDNKVQDETLLKYFGASSLHMCGNPDGECIAWAFNRLVKRKEKRKVLIVMSDGQPAASKGMSGIEYFTKQVIKEIEKGKVVDIYGLGLCNNAVQKYYEHNSVVNNPEEIPMKLLQLIERKLLNA